LYEAPRVACARTGAHAQGHRSSRDETSTLAIDHHDFRTSDHESPMNMTNPNFEPRFARVAATIGDPTRARMLASLLDGAMMTAGEIARACDVTPQTASVHLAKLVHAELLSMRTQGRHRYFKLADADVAHALEALAIVADKKIGVSPAQRRWSSDAMKPLRHARTCYGHLAGQLGVRLHDALIEREVLSMEDDRYVLLDEGRRWLADLGIDPATLSSSSRGIAYPCVDWSERRDHFAGPLAVALLERFMERHWLTRIGTSRALAVNDQTRLVFEDLLRVPHRHA
jgi:DNA-binding transcriptional ArsR family regulator